MTFKLFSWELYHESSSQLNNYMDMLSFLSMKFVSSKFYGYCLQRCVKFSQICDEILQIWGKLLQICKKSIKIYKKFAEWNWWDEIERTKWKSIDDMYSPKKTHLMLVLLPISIRIHFSSFFSCNFVACTLDYVTQTNHYALHRKTDYLSAKFLYHTFNIFSFKGEKYVRNAKVIEKRLVWMRKKALNIVIYMILTISLKSADRILPFK